MQMFIIISNVGIMINADVNVKNWLTKEFVLKDFFGIIVICECGCHKSCNVGIFRLWKL